MLQRITNAHVFAPEDLGVRELLLGGGRILALGDAGEALDASGATVTDLGGRRLLPGFIDGHAHLTGGGGESGFSSRVPPVPIGQFTRAGVTTAIGVLGTDDTTRDTKSLVACAYALREEGLGAWCHTGGYHVPPVTLTGNVRDDIVFVDPIIGVGEVAISDHRSSQPSLDEILRIASDAHVAGLITGKAGVLHLHLGDGGRGLDLVRAALRDTEIPARVFNPTHVNRQKALFDEALQLAGQGCTVDLTAYPVDEDDDGWSAETALLKYLASEAPRTNITVSSDGGGCLPKFNEHGEITEMDIGKPSELHRTFKAVVAAGVPLPEVLPAFTSNVANVLRLHDRGRIEVGKVADFIVLSDEDDIDDVVVGGRWHVRNGTQEVFGQFERSGA